MPLLSLPVDLRLEIYRQLLPTLCNDKLIEVSMLLQDCSYALDENVDMSWACDEAKDYIGLLSTCRTIRVEMSIMVNQFDVVLRLHELILNRDVRGAYYAASHPALQLNLPWQYCNKIRSEATWSGETRFTRVHSTRSALPAVLWHDFLECYEWVISILTSCATQPVVKKLSFTLNTPRIQSEMGVLSLAVPPEWFRKTTLLASFDYAIKSLPGSRASWSRAFRQITRLQSEEPVGGYKYLISMGTTLAMISII